MTVQAVLDRGYVRGRAIWPVFQYQTPGLLAVHVTERAIVFGLYSGAYLHGYAYLQEVSAESLAQMVAGYNQAMAELTAEEQRAIIDIAAKRYIEAQKLIAKDAALDTKLEKVGQKEAEVDAKEAALETDREALATKLVELHVAQEKTATYIRELEARIQEQVLDAAQVEAEITRQELIKGKAELDVLEIAIRALEIQAQIAEAAYRLSSIDVKKVELETDISRIGLDIAEVSLKRATLEADIGRINLDIEEVGVRLAGLYADIARLGVDHAEVAVKVMNLNSDIRRLVLEKDDVEFKRGEIQAEATRLGYDVSEVDIKISELNVSIANLQFAVAEIPVRRAMLEAETKRLTHEYNEIPVRVAELNVETVRLQTQKEYESLTAYEKDVAIAKTEAAREELAALELREDLGDRRIAAADTEIDTTIPRLSTAIAQERAADLDAQAARSDRQVDEYNIRKTSYDKKVQTSATITNLTTGNHRTEAQQIASNAQNTSNYYAAVIAANKSKNDNAHNYATAIQTANVVNTLTHQVGAAR